MPLERSRIADADMELALDAILDVAPYCNEEHLKAELRKISRQKPGCGTKIVLFNLRWNKNGMLELDFESDPADIRNPETLDDNEESRRQRTKAFKYRQSLRSYCSILFLTPKMEIFIRKKRVQTVSIKEALSRRRTMTYRPKGKTYDSRGGEVVGVVDFCDILQPTHNKQEFLVNTVEYRTAMSALAKKLDQYCSRTDHQGDTEGEDRNTRWVEVRCDCCLKWRLIPISAYEPVPNKWYCHMNPDLTKNRCDFLQEDFSDEENGTPSTPGSSSESSSRGRGRGRGRGRDGRWRSRGIGPTAILHSDRSDSGSDASTQESGSVPATAAPTTPATTSQGPEAASPKKRKQPAHQRTVGDKRARSIRDVKGQGHRVGVRGMRDVPTPRQVRLLPRHVTQALFASSNDQGSNGQGSNDQGSNRQASTSHHAPSVVTDDNPGVTGHDEDDDMGVSGHDEDDDTGVTRDQAAENNEQLRPFRRNVHTLLSFLVDLRLLDLPDVGPVEEIEDYVQRLLITFGLSFK